MRYEHGTGMSHRRVVCAPNGSLAGGRLFVENIMRSCTGAVLGALDLSFCGLDDSVGVRLGQMFASPRAGALHTLDASHNALGPTAGAVIAAGLQMAQNIRTLRLGFNPLGLEATMAIVDALKVSATLEAVGLENTVNRATADDPEQWVLQQRAARALQPPGKDDKKGPRNAS